MKSFLFFVFSLLLVTLSVHAETIDVNKADASAIAQHLTGIGPVKAQAIVDYRTEHGAFESLSDLTKVPGIGTAIVDSNRDKLSIGDISTNDPISPISDGKKLNSKPSGFLLLEQS